VSGAVGAGAVVGYLALSTPQPPSPAVAAATAPRGALELRPAVEDDGSWTEADRSYCQSVAKEAADTAAARLLQAVSDDRVGLGGPSSSMMERSASLLCAATRKPLHLCKSYWRKEFMQAVTKYAAEFRKVSSQMYWTNYNVEQRAQRNSVNENIDWDIVTNDLRQTTRELGRMHGEIVAAFRRLIADGIIKADYFGVFFGLGIPPDIAKLIGDARQQRRLCG
jgi:hypothetical protein